MKHLLKLSFVVPIVVFIGFGLIIGGSISGNDTIAQVGKIMLILIVPIIGVVTVGAGIFSAITGKGNPNTKNNTDNQSSEDAPSSEDDIDYLDNLAKNNVASKQVSTFGKELDSDEKAEERARIEDVNSSYGMESQVKQDAFIAYHASKSYKNSSKKEKVLSTLLLIFLLTCFALIFVFGYLNITAGVITCVCLFAGVIIVCIIVKKITESLSMRKIDVSSGKYEIARGEVRQCFLSSTTSKGGGSRRNSTRITGVVYRVVITANGNDYNAYTREYRNIGETVTIAIIGKKRASIVDDDAYVEKFDDTSNLTF